MEICRLALILAAPIAALDVARPSARRIDDTTITTRVKTAMLNDPNVGGLRIDVDTFKGVVTLSGRVKSQAEHDQAIALARRISGVVEVKDALQIIPETTSPSYFPHCSVRMCCAGTPSASSVDTDSLTNWLGAADEAERGRRLVQHRLEVGAADPSAAARPLGTVVARHGRVQLDASGRLVAPAVRR